MIIKIIVVYCYCFNLLVINKIFYSYINIITYLTFYLIQSSRRLIAEASVVQMKIS
jgi:hypothetical protein